MILWELARATGLVAVVLLTVVTAWGALVAGRAFKPAAPQVYLHRLLSTLALLLVVLHVGALVLDAYADVPLQALVGLDRRPGVVLGALALWLLVALPLSFRLLRAKRLSQRAWRRLHWSGYGLWALAVAHGLVEGSDSRSPWAIGLYGASAATVAAAAVWRSATPARPARPVRPARPAPVEAASAPRERATTAA